MSHLGGHFNFTCMCIPTLNLIKEKFNIKSMIDVGCGPAGMVEYANFIGIYSIGIEGDDTLEKKEYVKLHDYTLGKVEVNQCFDLAYSAEFLEHVEEEFLPNFMDTFQKAKYVFVTAAPPGQGGHHHVNEQPKDYWKKKFDEYGFDYDSEVSNELSKTMDVVMIANNSMFFKNRNEVYPEEGRKTFNIDFDYIKVLADRFQPNLSGKILINL